MAAHCGLRDRLTAAADTAAPFTMPKRACDLVNYGPGHRLACRRASWQEERLRRGYCGPLRLHVRIPHRSVDVAGAVDILVYHNSVSAQPKCRDALPHGG